MSGSVWVRWVILLQILIDVGTMLTVDQLQRDLHRLQVEVQQDDDRTSEVRR